jgi:alpha-L-rhamnosidase
MESVSRSRIFKGLIRGLVLILVLVWVWEHVQGAVGPMAPTRLRCEYLSNPLGIDVRQPRFAWVLRHTERGQTQTAYEILVATELARLASDQGDQWESGKVTSDDSTQVVYAGKALESGRTYYWKVRTWDKDGTASPYSEPARFEMGLLVRNEWKGDWIGGDNLFRKEFTLAARPLRARVYVTALGYYELHINGKRIGDRVLDPAWTDYPKRVLYSSYDVTFAVQEGANAVGVMLGGGWATQHARTIPPYYNSPALLLQMNIELEGGKHVSLGTDRTWKTARGPIVGDSIYDGEVYDAQLELPGWEAASFDDSGWRAAEAKEGTSGVLSAQMMPPIRVVDTLVPVSITNPRPRVYVYDLGQNFSGWARLRVRGARGTRVMMRFSELLYADGMINRENLLSTRARDIYILKGEGEEVYEPHFTYHGFRYLEVTGFPGTPSLDSIRGRVVHSAVETSGSFVASKTQLDQLQHNIWWGQSTNLQSLPTDDVARDERMGWMGDAQVTVEEAMLNFDMAALYTNFVRDIRDVQDAAGTLTDTVPHKYGERPADPGWGSTYPLLCWHMYEQYGDRRILKENYEGLKKYVDFLRSKAPDNVLRFSYYGDWVSIAKTPGALVSDAYYYYDVTLLARMAKILGRTDDEQSYTQLAAQIKDAFNREFYDEKTGSYASGSQTAQAMALYLSLADSAQAGHADSELFNDLVYTHDSHVTTGFIGIKYLFPVLTRLGYSDLAYDILTKADYPSYGYMIAHGATTIWELWQDRTGSSMNGHNLAMFCSVGAWLYQALAGINIDPEQPGYRHIRIEPQIVRDLTSASGTVETVRGTVSCSWTHAPGRISVEVVIPVNATATVSVPKEAQMTELTVREGDRVVWEKGQYVPGALGITGARAGNDRVVFDVGSGRYAFSLSGE